MQMETDTLRSKGISTANSQKAEGRVWVLYSTKLQSAWSSCTCVVCYIKIVRISVQSKWIWFNMHHPLSRELNWFIGEKHNGFNIISLEGHYGLSWKKGMKHWPLSHCFCILNLDDGPGQSLYSKTNARFNWEDLQHGPTDWYKVPEGKD